MNWHELLDPAPSGRLCLALVHSFWQVALLAAGAWGVDRLRQDGRPSHSYIMILAHELAHVRRHDLWVNLLPRIVQGLERDPYGPQVDLEPFFSKGLGDRITLLSTELEGGRQDLLAWSLRDRAETLATVRKVIESEPDSVRRTVAGAEAWMLGERGGSEKSAISVARHHIIVASDFGLLKEVAEPK